MVSTVPQRLSYMRLAKKMKAWVPKNDDFCNCGSNNWETVVDRQLTH